MAVPMLELGPEGSLPLLPAAQAESPHPVSLFASFGLRSSLWPNWNVRASLLFRAGLG